LTFYFDFCRCCFCCYCFCPGAPFCCRCRCLSALQDCGAAVSNDVATRDSGHSDSDVVRRGMCVCVCMRRSDVSEAIPLLLLFLCCSLQCKLRCLLLPPPPTAPTPPSCSTFRPVSVISTYVCMDLCIFIYW